MSLKFAFVNDFRSPDCAILALHFIMEKQVAGLSYAQMLDYPGFIGLFNPEFLAGRSRGQLVIRLKNMVRDIREAKDIPESLLPLREFFKNRKRHPNVKISLVEETPVSEGVIERFKTAIAAIEKEIGIKGPGKELS